MRSFYQLSIFLLILFSNSLTKAQPVFIKELPATSENFFTHDGILFFTSGDSLWKSNGTQAGTVLVKKINEPIKNFGKVTLGSFVFFTTTQADGKTALWRTNGYANTTYKLAAFPVINLLITYKNAVYAGIDDGVHGYELWKISSTKVFSLVQDFNPGVNSGLLDQPVIYNNFLYFKATTGTGGINLWKTNGSTASLAVDLAFDNYQGLIASELGIFIFRYIHSGLAELWITNGTTAGTRRVKQFTDNDCFSFLDYIIYNNKLFFHTIDGQCIMSQLWTSNGTEQGTQLIKEVTIDGGISEITKVNFRFVFGTEIQGSPQYLWRSDGTTAGTVEFYQLNAYPFGEFERVGNLLFFADHTSGNEHGDPEEPEDYYQLHQSGLHTENTQPLKDLFGGSYAGAANLRNADGKLFFTTYNDHFLAPESERVLRLYYYDPTLVYRKGNSVSTFAIGDIEAYPNPSASIFQFTSTAEQEDFAIAEIYSLNGVLIEKILEEPAVYGQELEFKWDAASYPDGIYVCKFRCGEQFKIKRIIKSTH